MCKSYETEIYILNRFLAFNNNCLFKFVVDAFNIKLLKLFERKSVKTFLPLLKLVKYAIQIFWMRKFVKCSIMFHYWKPFKYTVHCR